MVTFVSEGGHRSGSPPVARPVPVGQYPTPLHELPWLSNRIGRRVFVKRDDLSGLALGGNKARKLGYLIADAQARGCDTLISVGFVQSNNVVQAAAAATRFGLKSIVCLHGERPRIARGNVRLGEIYGVEFVFTEGRPLASVCQEIDSRVRSEGHRPYILPPGGSTPVGIRGFVDAVQELRSQADELGLRADTLVLPTGTGGTQAGLVLGALAIGWPLEILGISTGKSTGEMVPAMRQMIDLTASYLRIDVSSTAATLLVDDRFFGAGYAKPDATDFEAIRLVARGDGLLCDPVYNGRAMKGLLRLVDAGELPGKSDLVYWHTGGSPALFAFDEVSADSAATDALVMPPSLPGAEMRPERLDIQRDRNR